MELQVLHLVDTLLAEVEEEITILLLDQLEGPEVEVLVEDLAQLQITVVHLVLLTLVAVAVLVDRDLGVRDQEDLELLLLDIHYLKGRTENG
jgi:hypothetical protein